MKNRTLKVLAMLMAVMMLAIALSSCGLLNKLLGKEDPTGDGTTKRERHSSGDEDDTTKGGSDEDDTTKGGGDDPIIEPEGDAKLAIYDLQVRSINARNVTVSFQATGAKSFDVRYSDAEITAKNFDSAEQVSAEPSLGRDGIYTVDVDATANANTAVYVAAKAIDKDGNETDVISAKVGKTEKIMLTYDDNVFIGTTWKGFAELVDEQKDAGDPLNGKGRILEKTVSTATEWVNNANVPVNTSYSPIIDFGADYYIDCIYVYYVHEAGKLDMEYGTPFAWTNKKTYTPAEGDWYKLPVNETVRSVRLTFKNGEAPTEVLAYGYQVSEADRVYHNERKYPTIKEMTGECALINSTQAQIDSVRLIREYHNFGWTFVGTYKNPSSKCFSPTNNYMTNFDTYYGDLARLGYNVIPCIQFNAGISEVGEAISGDAIYQPNNYLKYASHIYQYVARYGGNANIPEENLKVLIGQGKAGLGYISWIELGNEPNLEELTGFASFDYAALMSAAYDGHCNTLGALIGAKNADPNIGVSTAGMAGIQTRMMKEMALWCRYNRPDGSLACDAFNVHEYTIGTSTINGTDVHYGISFEEAKIDAPESALSKLVEFRDKYFPDVEVWLTEFGWDTAYSWEIKTAAHAYGPYDSWDVQAMWLVRAYLTLSKMGVDKAFMYMNLDTGTTDETATGWYGTCGMVTDKKVLKDSYFYVATLVNVLGDMRFKEIVETGDEKIFNYRYASDDGKTAYAVWCPTTECHEADYTFFVGNGANVTITKLVDDSKVGESSTAKADANGMITVHVTEEPLFVTVG